MPTSSSGNASCISTGGLPPWPVCANAGAATTRSSRRSCPGAGRDGRSLGKAALRQGGADLSHQMQVEVEVVHRRELRAEHLARHHEMAQRPAAEVRARVTRAPFLDRPRIASVNGVAYHQFALAGEERPVASVAGGQDTIEEVIPHARKG